MVHVKFTLKNERYKLLMPFAQLCLRPLNPQAQYLMLWHLIVIKEKFEAGVYNDSSLHKQAL